MARSPEEDAVIKKMAELLRAGARMLSDVCPVHKVPLFRLKTGEIVCPACGRNVLIVKEGEPLTRVGARIFSEIEGEIYAKIRHLASLLRDEGDPARILLISKAISAMLEVVERIRRLSSSSS